MTIPQTAQQLQDAQPTTLAETDPVREYFC